MFIYVLGDKAIQEEFRHLHWTDQHHRLQGKESRQQECLAMQFLKGYFTLRQRFIPTKNNSLSQNL
jgi:hypothetical protein